MATEVKATEVNGNGVRKARGEAGPRTRAEQGTREKVCRLVRIRGVTDIMFDRYPGDNETKLEAWQKMYFMPDGTKTLCLPASNIISALSAQNTDSWPKRLLDSRKYKNFCSACVSNLTISPSHIPFSRDGGAIVFGRFEGDIDPSSGVYIHRSVARLEKGIPNPKVRPVLPAGWELEFSLTIWPNNQIQESQLLNVFTQGLLAVGLGTYRGQYGKAEIVHWE